MSFRLLFVRINFREVSVIIVNWFWPALMLVDLIKIVASLDLEGTAPILSPFSDGFHESVSKVT